MRSLAAGEDESPVERFLASIKGFKDGFIKPNSNKQVPQAVLRFRYVLHAADESGNAFIPILLDVGKKANAFLNFRRPRKKNNREQGAIKIEYEETRPACKNCLMTVLNQTLLLGVLGNLLQAIHGHFKDVRRCFGKKSCHRVKSVPDVKSAEKTCHESSLQSFFKELSDSSDSNIWHVDEQGNGNGTTARNRERLPLELCLSMILEFCSQLKIKKNSSRENTSVEANGLSSQTLLFQLPGFNDIYLLKDVLTGGKKNARHRSRNLGFARVHGASVVFRSNSTKEEDKGPETNKEENATTETEYNRAQKLGADAQKLGYEIVNFSVENVKRLKSVLSAMPLADLIALVPQKGRSSQDHPNKKRLYLVQDFFKYTQTEGKRFFDELDRDGDGKITLEDLEVAMRKRRLPSKYAREFLRRTRSHIFAKSIGWKQFLSLMEQKEAAMLQAYNSLCLSKSGTLQKNQVMESLKKSGLPASEENVAAMMRYLDADTEGSISYGHFRNFMLLLPPERLEDDIRSLWFEAATVVAVPPPIPISTGAGNVLVSALAGGLSCALSTSLMHPLDTLKTRVQASTLSFPVVVSKIPEIGVTGLYRGSIPAILGQFSSHGLRTGFSEATKKLLENTSTEFSDIQVESISSFVGTVLGTAMRIPCEVLKQRLQAGIFDNVGAAILATWEKDGLKGFFRGTGITLCREVPFYVAGAVLYNESKKVAQQLVNRELAPWETIAVGALSGGLAAVATTPFDVLKTRMMTATPGVPVTMFAIASTILQHEGALGLFKGAVPRFFWIAPLGAMNFAGYELAKKTIIAKHSNVQ